VPAGHADGESSSVILHATDPAGQEAFQTFRVSVRSVDPPRPGEILPEEKEAAYEAPPPRVETPASLKPPTLDRDRVERVLPSPVTDLAVGGGGRYLILHLPKEKKLAVFDVTEAKVVQWLPAEAGKLKFAAGLDKLLMVVDNKTVERWSLTTFKKEDSAELPFNAVVHSVVMGSASSGPLVLGGPELRGPRGLPLRFLDVATLREKAFNVAEASGAGMVGTHPQYPHVMRVSADGRVIGMWNVGLSPSGLQTVILDGVNLRVYHDHTSVGHIVPGPDGKLIFTGCGVLNPQVKFLIGQNRPSRFTLPAHQGGYYLATKVVEPQRMPAADFREPLSLYLLGDPRPVCPLPEIEVTRDAFWGRGGGVPLDQRIHLLPDARLLVILPPAADRLVLHRFDPEAALAKAGLDYLFVTSQPLLVAQSGQTYMYQLGLMCKARAVRYRIELGPPGLEVARGGKVTWAVPDKFKGQKVPVVLNIRTDSGQECYHTFTIEVKP
jgi:hypothetical protein